MDVMIVVLAVMGAFYFILLRPVINQQRQHRRDISSLEIGDEVLTTGGFYATVKEINTFEDRPMELVLEAAPGVHLRATTQSISAISRRLADEEPDPVEEAEEDWDDDEDDDEEWDEEDWDDEDWDEDDEEWDEEDDDWEAEDDEARLAVTQRRRSS
jgi:preprotein translocase YajC subunit